jgi:hypothetical protein
MAAHQKSITKYFRASNKPLKKAAVENNNVKTSDPRAYYRNYAKKLRLVRYCYVLFIIS